MKLFLYCSIILLCILVQPIINMLAISKLANIYPYFLIPLLGLIGLACTPKKTYSLQKILITFTICIITLAIILYYQNNILHEPTYFILYAFRFYFGAIFMTLCLIYAFRSTSYNTRNLQSFFLKFIEFIIILNFSLCVIELLYSSFSYGLAPWTPPERLTRDLNTIFQDSASYRAYGFTNNNAVLGGFSVFLSTYYLSQVFFNISYRNYFFLALGILTVAFSQSGTGFIIGLIAFLGISIYSFYHKKYFFPVLFILSSLTAFLNFAHLQFNNDGRFSLSQISYIWNSHGKNVFAFLQTESEGKLSNILLGSINFQKFAILGDLQDLIDEGSSLYDFALIAMALETGILGIAIYLFSYFFFASIAFPKQPLAKFSMLLLIASSFHYGASFWICSQVMSATILAFHIHLQYASKLYPQPSISPPPPIRIPINKHLHKTAHAS